MIDIKVNNQSLVLPNDVQIRLDIFSPFFQDEAFVKPYTNFFDVPDDVEGINRRIFELSTFIQIRNRIKIYSGKIFVDGIDFLGDCSIVLNEVKGNSFKISVLQKVNLEVNDSLQSLTQNPIQIKTGLTDTESIPALVTNVKAATYPTYPYAFPEIKVTEWAEDNQSFNGIVNKYEENVWNWGGTYTPENKTSLVPMFYLNYIISCIFNKIKNTTVSLIGSFFTSPILKQLFVYNNYAIDKAEWVEDVVDTINLNSSVLNTIVYFPYGQLAISETHGWHNVNFKVWDPILEEDVITVSPTSAYDESTGGVYIENEGIHKITISMTVKVWNDNPLPPKDVRLVYDNNVIKTWTRYHNQTINDSVYIVTDSYNVSKLLFIQVENYGGASNVVFEDNLEQKGGLVSADHSGYKKIEMNVFDHYSLQNKLLIDPQARWDDDNKKIIMTTKGVNLVELTGIALTKSQSDTCTIRLVLGSTVKQTWNFSQNQVIDIDPSVNVTDDDIDEGLYFEINTNGGIANALITITNKDYEARSKYFNSFSSYINPEKHFPNMPIKDFIKHIKDYFCLTPLMAELSNNIEFVFNKDLLTSAAEDFTNKFTLTKFKTKNEKQFIFTNDYSFYPAADEEMDIDTLTFVPINNYEAVINPANADANYILKSTNEAFSYKRYKPGSANVKYLTLKAQNFKTDLKDEQKSVSLNVVIIPSKSYYDPLTLTYSQFAELVDRGITSFYSILDKASTDKVALSLIYNNIVSSTGFKSDGTATGLGGRNLYFKSTQSALGIYDDYHKDWYNFLSSAEEVTFESNGSVFTIIDFIKIKTMMLEPNQTIRKLYINGINYYPEQISLILTKNGIKDVELTCLK